MPKYRFDQIAINSTEKRKPVEEDRFTYLGLEHLDSGCLKVNRFGSDTAPIGDKLVMHKGDVLFGKRRAYQKKVAIAPFDGIFSAHGMVLRPNEAVIDKEFFPLFISSDCFLNKAIAISVGSLSPTINWRDLRELEFELPDLKMQKRVAVVLWSINRTMEAYKQLISATDDLVKSQFVVLYGDPIENNRNWETRRLSDCLLRIETGKSLNCEGHARTGDFPAVLKLSAITYGYYNPHENKQLPDCDLFCPELEVKPGDILFSRKNTLEYVGKTVYVFDSPGHLMLPDLIFRIVPGDCVRPIYLQQLFDHPRFRRIITGLANGTTGSMPNISKSSLLNLAIPLPPLEEQEKIERFVRQSDKSKFVVLKRPCNVTVVSWLLKARITGGL